MSGDGGREWELMRSYASSAFIAMVYVLFSMAYMTVVACADKWSVGSSLAVLLTGFVAALCCIRRLVADSSVNGNGLKSRMKRRMRDFALSGNAAVPAINYRILYGRAKEYMEERRPYLNPSFSLTDLAKAMCCNSGYVSKSINSCTGKNYSQFVNGYRVEYAMEMFRKDNSLMVSELMQVSGFSNKVTFNLAFKSVTGLTPGEWCRQCLESIQKEKGLSNLKAQRK